MWVRLGEVFGNSPGPPSSPLAPRASPARMPTTPTPVYRKCKPCCERSLAICQFKGHNAGQRPVSTSDNPTHLARPVPSAPLYFPSSFTYSAGLSTSRDTLSGPLSGNVISVAAMPPFVSDGFTLHRLCSSCVGYYFRTFGVIIQCISIYKHSSLSPAARSDATLTVDAR